MGERSIIIIGAGLAGLATGCYAQMNGYRTHIFERHTRPGGVCTAWKRKGYTIDGCIHWLNGARPGCAFHRLYTEVGALEGNRLIPIDHFCRLMDEASGKRLDIVADLDRLAADMKALAPQDEQAIDELIQGARALQGFDPPLNKPLELWGPLDSLKQMWSMRRWLKHLRQGRVSVEAFCQRIRDPFLRKALSSVFVSQMPIFFLQILLAQLSQGELATVEGGSLAFALGVANRYRDLGGHVTYGAAVEKILVEGDRAVGVRLADGSEHRADIVVSAADGHATIFGMLGGRYADDAIRERYSTWPLFAPLIVVSFGVTQPYPDQPHDSRIDLVRPLSVAGQEVDGLTCRVFNRDPTLFPNGKTVVQATLTSDFDYWDGLHRQDRSRYEAEKERVAQQVLARLDGHLPGLSHQVEMIDVATPHTFWRYTRNYRGAYEGWLMSAETTLKPLPKTLPGLEGFYMAGQWVEPGGGVPPALYSGRQVVQILCHQDGMPFTTTVP